MRITCSTVLGAIRWTQHLAVWNQGKWGEYVCVFYTAQLGSSTVDVYASH